jgi:hypothetical protein
MQCYHQIPDTSAENKHVDMSFSYRVGHSLSRDESAPVPCPCPIAYRAKVLRQALLAVLPIPIAFGCCFYLGMPKLRFRRRLRRSRRLRTSLHRHLLLLLLLPMLLMLLLLLPMLLMLPLLRLLSALSSAGQKRYRYLGDTQSD